MTTIQMINYGTIVQSFSELDRQKKALISLQSVQMLGFSAFEESEIQNVQYTHFSIPKTSIIKAYTNKTLDQLLTGITNLFRRLFGYDTLTACRQLTSITPTWSKREPIYERCYIQTALFTEAQRIEKAALSNENQPITQQTQRSQLPQGLLPYKPKPKARPQFKQPVSQP